MLPAATLPAARYPSRLPGSPLRAGAAGAAAGGGPPGGAAAGTGGGPGRGAGDAGDLAGRGREPAELPGPGWGIVACGALPGAVAPVPAWTAGELAAAGVPAEPGRCGMARGWGW